MIKNNLMDFSYVGECKRSKEDGKVYELVYSTRFPHSEQIFESSFKRDKNKRIIIKNNKNE
jgi:ABC-type cobalamin/Fe3+-siderophores transport system ATPase subunit